MCVCDRQRDRDTDKEIQRERHTERTVGESVSLLFYSRETAVGEGEKLVEIKEGGGWEWR